MARWQHSRLMIAVSVGAMVIPALLLSVVALRLLRQFERVERRSWEEIGSSLAELSIGHAQRRLWEEEQRIMMGVRVSPPRTRQAVVATLSDLEMSNALYAVAFWVTPTGERWFAGTPPGGALGAAVDAGTDAARTALAEPLEGPAPFRHLAPEVDHVDFQITFFTVPDVTGAGVLGAVVLVWDLDHVGQRYLPGLFAKGPPVVPSLIRADLRGRVSLALLDRRDQLFFVSRGQSSGDPATGALIVRPFQGVLEFWRLGIALDDREFDRWMRSVRTVHVALIGGMLALILISAWFVVRWIGREIEVAELRTRLVAGVGHELRTPLSLIQLYSETLELGRVADPEQQRAFLRIIAKESRRLARLIDDVLSLSGSRRESARYTLVEADIGNIVRDTLDAYRYQLDEQGFELVRRLAKGRFPGRFDTEALMQALINLLDNAVKYSDGRKEIEVELARQGDRALIRVHDRGIGIPAGEERRIFDPFYRVPGDHQRRQRGLGLGLPLVREVVEAHGGSVTVHGRPGEGSTFTIELPLGEDR